jgi:hypothetical protein
VRENGGERETEVMLNKEGEREARHMLNCFAWPRHVHGVREVGPEDARVVELGLKHL